MFLLLLLVVVLPVMHASIFLQLQQVAVLFQMSSSISFVIKPPSLQHMTPKRVAQAITWLW